MEYAKDVVLDMKNGPDVKNDTEWKYAKKRFFSEAHPAMFQTGRSEQVWNKNNPDTRSHQIIYFGGNACIYGN